jgi:hypothetical protein
MRRKIGWDYGDGAWIFIWVCQNCGKKNYDDFGASDCLPDAPPETTLPCSKCGRTASIGSLPDVTGKSA